MEQQLSQPTPAHMYEGFYGPGIFRPCAEILLERAAPKPGESVLDIASGTGIVSRAVAKRVGQDGRVVGLDINPAMVEVARSIGDAGGASIEYVQGDATKPDFQSESFDLILCQQGVQFFPDRAEAIRQMHRMLVRGGRVAIAAWLGLDRHPIFAALAEAEIPHLEPLGLDPEDAVQPFSLPADELIGALSGAGFFDVESAEYTIECRFPGPESFVENMEFAYGAVIPQFAADPAAFRDFVDAVVADTRDVVRRYIVGDHVVFPMHTTIAVARKA